MKVNFYKKNPKDKISPVVCVVSDSRDYRIKLYPGVKVARLKIGKRRDTGDITLNKFLWDADNSYEKRVEAIYREAVSDGILPDKDYFVKRLEPQPIEEQPKTDFWEMWKLYINGRVKLSMKKSTQKKFACLETHLLKFEHETGQRLEPETIDARTLEALQGFFYHTQDLNTGSTAKYIGLLRMFLNWTVQNGYCDNMDWRHFKPIRQPDSLKVVMSDQDIERIKKVELNGKNYLKNVRRLFLLACDTGLRFSDLSRISRQHLKETPDGYKLQIRQTKTEGIVTVPLTQSALKTVQDLIDGKLHGISNQKLNKYVKELCRLAGIDEPFEVHTYKGKERTTTAAPKWSLVTTHTGRRTFATNLMNRGVPAEVVMVYTGHKDYRSFAAYVNIPQNQKDDMVRRALEGKPVNNGSGVMYVEAS